jgi:hypothetical protein
VLPLHFATSGRHERDVLFSKKKIMHVSAASTHDCVQPNTKSALHIRYYDVRFITYARV